MFSNSIFLTSIVSVLSTYILWVFISIVLDPWHIVTSVGTKFLLPGHLLKLFPVPQCLVLSPTYVNVINAYAFVILITLLKALKVMINLRLEAQQRLSVMAKPISTCH